VPAAAAEAPSTATLAGEARRRGRRRGAGCMWPARTWLAAARGWPPGTRTRRCSAAPRSRARHTGWPARRRPRWPPGGRCAAKSRTGARPGARRAPPLAPPARLEIAAPVPAPRHAPPAPLFPCRAWEALPGLSRVGRCRPRWRLPVACPWGSAAHCGGAPPRSYREAAAACAVLPAAAAAPLARSAFCRPLPEDAAAAAAAQSDGLQARPRRRLPCASSALQPAPHALAGRVTGGSCVG